MIRTLLLASAAFAAFPAHAEAAQPPADETAAAPADADAEAPQARQQHVDESTDVIITAPYRRNRIDVLSGTSVVSGEELARDLRPTIGETLASQPGVSATSFGPNASRPVLRGFSGDRVRVLIDGIGSFDVSNTSADHATVINPLTARRIEVLRGPAALLFGSSAIGGVVNVVDGRIPREMPESPAHFEGIAGYGSAAEERTAGGALDVPIGSKIVAHVDGSYLRTGDLRTGGYILSRPLRAIAAESDEEEVRENATLRGKLENSAAETWEVAGGLGVITGTGNFGFSVSHYESTYGIPPRLEYFHEEHDDHEHGDEEGHDEEGHSHEDVQLKVRQTRFDVRGEVQTGGGFLDRIRVRLGAADYRHDEIEPSGEIGTSFFNQGYEGRLELVQAQKGGWQGAIGGQFLIRDFRAVGEEKFVPPSVTQQYGVFTLQSFDLGAVKAEVGARYEHSNIAAKADVDLGNDAFTRRFDAFSASAGASYALAEGVRFGVNVARTERAPSSEELFANGPHAGTQSFEIGDPDFAKESSWGVEATLKGDAGPASFSLAAYHNWFDNYIYQTLTGEEEDHLPVFRYAQGDARVWGIEAEAAAKLGTLGGYGISVDALGDYVRATIVDEGPAPRIPPLRFRGGIEAQDELLHGRVEVEHVFDQDRVTEFETPTDAYTMVNLSLSIHPFGEGSGTSLTLAANNLFDVEARRHASVLKDFAPLAGRDLRATLRVRL